MLEWVLITSLVLKNKNTQDISINLYFSFRCATNGEKGGGGGRGVELSCLYFKTEKIGLILEKITQIIFIYGLNFSFKMLL